MGYNEIMAIPVEHLIAVVPTNNLIYPLRVVCSCQWQAEASGREAADFYVRLHQGRQLSRGNTVVVAEEKANVEQAE